MNPVEQIINIYNNEFWWHEKNDPANLRSYLWTCIDRGNLFWVTDNDQVIGVCETWKIDFDTLGKIVCKICDPIENVETQKGHIAFLCNVWIHPDHRKSSVIKKMKQEWIKRYGHCDYFCGHAQRKSVGMYKTFKTSELKASAFYQGE